jgi:hypothetical protein
MWVQKIKFSFWVLRNSAKATGVSFRALLTYLRISMSWMSFGMGEDTSATSSRSTRM